MKMSQAGIDALLKRFEGLRLRAYRPTPNDPWTIGYGQTGKGILQNTIWTEQQAEDALKEAMVERERDLLAAVKVPLTQYQFDALIDFIYNLGIGRFKKSTLLKKLNKGDYAGAANQFQLWNLEDGVPLLGLIRRREAEKQWFLRTE